MVEVLSIDRKKEAEDFMNLLREMNLNEDEQKVMLGIVQGIKLSRDMERQKTG